MTIEAPHAVVRDPQVAVATDESSYVDWPAIIAGAVLASAISILLLTFGSAIGLSMTNPFGREGVSLVWIAIASGIWVLWVQISAFLAGGYLTGRMRRRKLDATEHESDVRDGAHGLLVWATGLVLGTILAFGGLASVAQGVFGGAGALAGSAIEAAGDAIDNPFDYAADTLFRDGAPGDIEAARGQAVRIFANSVATGQVSDADRTYLASVVAAQTNLSPADAEARVNEVVATVEAAQAQAVAAAEQARRIGILVAFLTAAALAVSAAGAYFAAGMGGSHRDKGVEFPAAFRRIP